MAQTQAILLLRTYMAPGNDDIVYAYNELYIAGDIRGLMPSIAHIRAKTFAISAGGNILVSCERINGDDNPRNKDTLAAEIKILDK